MELADLINMIPLIAMLILMGISVRAVVKSNSNTKNYSNKYEEIASEQAKQLKRIADTLEKIEQRK